MNINNQIIQKIFLLLVFIPFYSLGQTWYSNQNNKYKNKWSLKINKDSTIYLIQNSPYSYDEYNGVITKINDTLFNVKAKLIFSQGACRAIGDSLFYASADSIIRNTIPKIKIIYSNNESMIYYFKGKSNITIPINKKLFNQALDKNFFYVSAEHIDPITDHEVRIKYRIKDEYCMELYTENEISFNVTIKKNKLKKTGRDQIGNLLLTKTVTY